MIVSWANLREEGKYCFEDECLVIICIALIEHYARIYCGIMRGEDVGKGKGLTRYGH